MKRSGLVISTKALALAALVLAACGGGGGGKDGGPNQLGDGFISTTCAADTDCSADACSDPHCSAAKMCTSTAKTCTTANGCTITAGTCVSAMCNASSGKPVWTSVPMADGQTCTTDGGGAGTCSSGNCNPIPTCYDSNTDMETLVCGADNGSDTASSNDPNDFENNAGSAVVDSYACAPTEAGPEVGFLFQLDPSFTTPISVTLSLKLADFDPDTNVPTVAADQTAVDLDLIVLEGSCTGTATCANPSSGSTFQGITAGTSAEKVTFMADPTMTYYIVVDSKDMSQVGGFVLEAESCGACALTSSTDVSCNSSYPVDSTTTGGSTVLTNYTCGTTMLAYAGAEVPFLLRDDSGVARSITATITGATANTGLLVLNQAADGDCQGTDCIANAIVATDNASTSVTWTTDPVDEDFGEGPPAFTRNWVVVDTPGTSNTSFGLSVSCSPYCSIDPDESLYCEGNMTNNTEIDDLTTAGGPTQESQWGPTAAPCGGSGYTNLAGPEHIVEFTPDGTGTNTYTFELQSNDPTNNLSLLILDAGKTTTPACNPTATCATFAAATGSAATGSTGTLTTNVAQSETANVTLSAVGGHTYLLVVDGTDADGADFNILIQPGGTGCQ